MAASLGNAVGVYSAFQKTKEGKRMQKEAQSEIDNFSWQDIDGAIPVNTVASDNMREDSQRTSANAIDAIRTSGVRGIMGALPKVMSMDNIANQENRAYIDNQLQKRAYTKLGMTERRQTDELQGYGQMLNTGLAMKYQGYTDMMNAGNAQSEHNMDLFNTFGSSAMGGGGGGG